MEDKYDTIRKLDEERNGSSDTHMTSIVDYMMPHSFCMLDDSTIRMDHIRNYVITSKCRPKEFVKCVNKSNKVRVKNIRTGILIEFSAMINASRFVGTSGANMRCGFGYETARVYRVCEGGERYVFEYDGKIRPLEYGDEDGGRWTTLNVSIEVVSSTGRRRQHGSYLSVARQLGVLVGHVIEEKERWMNDQLAKRYITEKCEYTIEFGGERRQKDYGRGINGHWKGIYNEDGDWEKIRRIKVTYGNPQMRD